jgi:protein-S-isoprenylcysteine O-methyltransferase
MAVMYITRVHIIARMWLPLVLGLVFQISENFIVGLKRPAATASTRDRGSAIALWIGSQGGASVAYLYVAFWIASFDVEIPWSLRWAGGAIAIAGVAFRVWSVKTLGLYFTRTVRVADQQPLIESGPYRLVRHPAYTGFLAVGLGCGLALGTWLACAIIFVPTLVATVYRVRVEEEALVDGMGERYSDYIKRTKRFIPYLV